MIHKSRGPTCYLREIWPLPIQYLASVCIRPTVDVKDNEFLAEGLCPSIGASRNFVMLAVVGNK